MTPQSPAAALNGVQCGNVCSGCNRRIRTGDKAVVYATHYDADGWVIRRVWCDECGSTTIGLPTDGADEVVVRGVYWSGRIVSVKTVDRNRP
jgi:hypothetical protein